MFTNAEKTFLDRMAFHVERGLSFDEAAQAVIDDDNRVRAAAMEKSEIGQRVRDAVAGSIWLNCQRGKVASRVLA